MQLDQAAIRLRARDPWEAVDLGVVMMRAWWRPVYAALLAVVLPITVVLHLLFAARPWLALLITWWLKPFYDRVILHVLAHAVFAEPPSVRQTLASLRRLVGETGLGAALLWRRFDSARAFNLPVHQLEGQRGTRARDRRLVLGRRAATQASGVFTICVLFELVTTLSLSAIVDLVTPATVDAEYGLKSFFRHFWDPNASSWGRYLNHAFYVAALVAIEPLYVAGSFALYLNRRTLLEAWDLELGFRRMARRATERGVASGMGAALLAACALAAVAQPPDARAAERTPREVIREVLAEPEFQEYRTERIWQRRIADESKEPVNFEGLGRLLRSLADAFAGFTRIAAYALLAVGGYLLLRHVLHNLGRWQRSAGTAGSRAPPQSLFGLDVRPEALPANLAAAAAAVADSDPRLALSLLYRGALATLIHRDRIDFAAGDTEAECMQRIERVAPAAMSAYFRRLVCAWTQAAYARRGADPSAIRSLCAEWTIHFSVPVQAA